MTKGKIQVNTNKQRELCNFENGLRRIKKYFKNLGGIKKLKIKE